MRKPASGWHAHVRELQRLRTDLRDDGDKHLARLVGHLPTVTQGSRMAAHMRLAFVDESGDPGATGSFSYSLACLLVREEDWLPVLDQMIELRRFLRDRFGVPVRMELKANTVIRGSGPLRRLDLNAAERRRIFRLHLRIQDRLPVRTFSVVIDKPHHFAVPQPSSPEHRAWEYLLQRLERESNSSGDRMLIFHDQGNDALIRRLARQRRRYAVVSKKFGPGTFNVPFTQLVEDPVPRDSRQSYLLQLADFAAYSAFRKVYPPTGGPTGITRVAAPDCWDLIGASRHIQVSGRRDDGIVWWP